MTGSPKPPSVAHFEQSLTRQFPIMAQIVERMWREFGLPWGTEFSDELTRDFGGDEGRVDAAARGYALFSLEAMRLQKSFEETLRYEPKTYAQATREVNYDERVALGQYYPGLLLSNYLWPHHYRQLEFFRRSFLPLLREQREPRFYDVGVGTGFYSRQLLSFVPEASGLGFDISPHARDFATSMLSAWDVDARYQIQLRDVLADAPLTPRPVLLSVQVIEHLEDPPSFLAVLAHLLTKDGIGFITTALTAANADHIYLYNEVREVADQVQSAGFRVESFVEEAAYESRDGKPVPRVAAFIVRHAASHT